VFKVYLHFPMKLCYGVRIRLLYRSTCIRKKIIFWAERVQSVSNKGIVYLLLIRQTCQIYMIDYFVLLQNQNINSEHFRKELVWNLLGFTLHFPSLKTTHIVEHNIGTYWTRIKFMEETASSFKRKTILLLTHNIWSIITYTSCIIGRVPIRIFYHTSSISIVICLLRAHLVRVPIHVVRRTILDKLASALDNYQVRSSAH
jgi:hypothetical protein